MTSYRARRNEILDETGRQIAVVLAVGCSKKLAAEMAAYAAQQANHAERQRERAAGRRDEKGEPSE